MGADYHVVSTSFISGTQDWADDERMIGLYLLVCEHRRTEGLFKIPAPIAAYELSGDDGGRWPVQRVEKALRGLERRGWIVREGVWLCICKALKYKHNRPLSPSAIKGALAQVENAPRGGAVWDAFTAAAERWVPDFGDVIAGRKVVAPDGRRGLILKPVDSAPPTPPTTGPSVPEPLPQSNDDLSRDGATPLGEYGPRTSSTSLSTSTSTSTSISTSLPAPQASAPGPGRQAGDPALGLLVDSICSAALRGPSELLRAQASDDAARADIRTQLEIAGPKAAAAAGHVADWVSRRHGEPLKAKSLSFLVRSATAKVAEQGLFASTTLEVVPAAAEASTDPEVLGVWVQIIDALRGRVDTTTIELWLQPLRPLSLSDDGTLVLGGARHLADWARDRCTPLLTEVALATGRGVTAVEIRAVEFAEAAA